MRIISADYVFPVSSSPIKNGIIEIEDSGEILSVSSPSDNHSKYEIEKYRGILIPGFINAHCHLELSHLKGQIKKKEGLVQFLRKIIDQNNGEENKKIAAMQHAEIEMTKNGIVAVGDISNSDTSFIIKKKGTLYYHSFIEMLGIDPGKAENRMLETLELRKIAEVEKLPYSLTVHSTYSISDSLLSLFQKTPKEYKKIVTLHYMESEEEGKMFKQSKGDLYNFLIGLTGKKKLEISNIKNSFDRIIPHITESKKLLLVHNTYAEDENIKYAMAAHPSVFWILCPNSNVYIEGKLPDIPMIIERSENIALGTDSLASNTQLSILEEMKTIQRSFPDISLEQLIKWGTLNGADALNVDSEYGSLEQGKKPGINLIQNIDIEKLKLKFESNVKVIVNH